MEGSTCRGDQLQKGKGEHFETMGALDSGTDCTVICNCQNHQSDV